MTGKVVLLPREWNSPKNPPEREDQVIIKYGPKEYDILWYDTTDKEWRDTLNGDPAFLDNDDALESIEGWCYLVQQ